MLKAREIVIVFIIIKWLFHFIVTILRELRLQDNIVSMGRRLQQLGQDILNQPIYCKGGPHDNRQSSHMSPHDP